MVIKATDAIQFRAETHQFLSSRSLKIKFICLYVKKGELAIKIEFKGLLADLEVMVSGSECCFLWS